MEQSGTLGIRINISAALGSPRRIQLLSKRVFVLQPFEAF